MYSQELNTVHATQHHSTIFLAYPRLQISLFLILAALPWLDSSKIRSAVFRPLYKQFYWILVADVLILGYVGAMPAEGLYLLIARVATAYYFLHFLVILPVLSSIEKTERRNAGYGMEIPGNFRFLGSHFPLFHPAMYGGIPYYLT